MSKKNCYSLASRVELLWIIWSPEKERNKGETMAAAQKLRNDLAGAASKKGIVFAEVGECFSQGQKIFVIRRKFNLHIFLSATSSLKQFSRIEWKKEHEFHV